MGTDRRIHVKWVFVCGGVAASGQMLIGGADFRGPDHLANMWHVCVCVHNYVGLLCFPLIYFFLLVI